jgi:hypothetical protein
MDKMENFKHVFMSWIASIIFSLTTAIVFLSGLFNYTDCCEDKKPLNLYNYFEIFGMSATVAIAVLGFWAYLQLGYNAYKKHSDLKKLKKLGNLKKAAMLIQFGGKNISPEKEMKNYCQEALGIPEELCQFASFGKVDEHGYKQVKVEDIFELKKFIHEFQKHYSDVEEFHILIQGIGVAYAVCADILSNGKPWYMYHYQVGKYEPWYSPEKNVSRLEETVNENQVV